MANHRHQVTADAQKRVKAFAGWAVPHEQIADMEGITAKTLRKYYKDELALGAAEANAAIGRSLFEQAVGRPAQFDADRNMIREELKPDKSAAIFLGKSRLGLRETSAHELTGPNGGPVQLAALDLTVLSKEEVQLFNALLRKAKERKAATGA